MLKYYVRGSGNDSAQLGNKFHKKLKDTWLKNIFVLKLKLVL